MFFVLLVLLCNLLVCESFASFQEYVDEEKTTEFRHCLCVPFWQCKDDFSGLIENGVELMDIRVARTIQNSSTPCTGDFDVCCQVECGKRRKVSTNLEDPEMSYRKYTYFPNYMMGYRILGENNEAEFAEFPWMLGILKNKSFKCGASLIHPQVAITAAHCVMGTGPFKVRAGEWNWESNSEALPYQERSVSKVIIHESFQPSNLHNDIALLIMDPPFFLAENVGVVCLPPPQHPNHDGRRCTATGWGKNSYKKGTYQSKLKKVQLPVVSKPYCTSTLQNARLGPYFKLHKSFICAGGEHNKDTCKGDGGSPLVCPVKGLEGTFEQVGIVSWGLTCGLQNTPGVYVNVGLFTNWIDEKMTNMNFDTNIYKYRQRKESEEDFSEDLDSDNDVI